jgi:pimeloyl-ACP methyl ester carboxylesterase
LATARSWPSTCAVTGPPTRPPAATAPTLILWADQDGLFKAAEQEALRAALPNARFESVQGLGHNMFWEEPERIGALIAGFLDG